MTLVRGLVLIAAILAGAALLHRRPSHHGSLDLGIWYWHSPFVVTAQDAATLKSAGIRTVYARAGTFTTDGSHLLLMLPQVWKSNPKGLDIVAVFNFDPGLLSHFDKLSVESMSADISPRITSALDAARAKGIEPRGVQLDIDCPTRLLPKYAQFLASVRKGIPKTLSFSITALPTWLSSRDFAQVASQVDFVAPQFYEGRVGMTLADIKPVSDPAALKAGLKRLDRLGVPFYAGLPAYGHAMLFDEHGRLATMYRGLSAEDALRHPSLKFQSTTPIDEQGHRASRDSYIGEDLLTLKATRADPEGRGKGASIAYLLPSEEMVTSEMAILDQDAPANCRGAILYRFPEPGETTCLSLQTIAAAIHHSATKVDFSVDIKSHSVPYALIGDTPGTSVPREVSLRFQPTGNVATTAAPDAFQALIEFDRPGIEDVAPGDFDSVEVGAIENGAFIPCGRARATAILLSRFNAQPGIDLRCGGIDLAADGPSTIHVLWTAHGMGCFRAFSGTSPTRKLAELHR